MEQSDRRKYQRFRLYYYLNVYDKDSGELRGSVVNISKGGMCLVTDTIMERGSNCELKLKLPQGSYYGKYILVHGKCRWSFMDEREGNCKTGIEFRKKPDFALSVIENLISDLVAKGAMPDYNTKCSPRNDRTDKSNNQTSTKSPE